MSKKEFFGFSSSQWVFSLDGDKVVPRKLQPFEEPYAPAKIEAHTFALPLQMDGYTMFELPLGLTLVSGRTAAGKSTFLRELEKLGTAIRVYRAVEPHDDIEDLNFKSFSSADGALVEGIRDCDKQPGLIGIDSLRAALFEATGSAGSKGVSTAFFTAITRVSNQLAACGYSAIATVNPMEQDPDFVDSFLSKLSASVPCYIDIAAVSRGADGRASRIEGTVSVRPNRIKRPFILDGSGKVRVEKNDRATSFRFERVSAVRDVGTTPFSVVNSFDQE